MLPDDPRHGTYAGAQKHWKDEESACEPCLAASRRSNKRRELNTMAGNPAHVPLGEAAHRIVSTAPRVPLSAATGIRPHRLRDFMLGGPEKIVHRNTRARILAAGRPWTAIGIQRRLQALACAGWSGRAISERTGIFDSTLCDIRRRQTLVFIRANVAATIVDLYANLDGQDAPAGRSATEARSHATRMSWSPAHAWLDIDDPDETPDPGWAPRPAVLDLDEAHDEVVVERILSGAWRLQATRAERVEVYRRWLAAGGTQTGLENRTGWKVKRDVTPYLPREESAA